MSHYTIVPATVLLQPLHLDGADAQDLLGQIQRFGLGRAHVWEADVYRFSLEVDEAGVWHISSLPEFQRYGEQRNATDNGTFWSRMFRRN